ncbi:TRAP transporter large permease [Brevibacillus ruminantium]|uniref:TRAP transporter large permease n=1 Tax=Brevibacillus ruminantium TaxID=2950604 RepID=A0ABY4WFU4_9BACL|nr:TRAP transporter large permease [Brevibacillus ruminantium]USG64690.1 TRAP transporter large permease [Brevibacillus ruminantium]
MMYALIGFVVLLGLGAPIAFVIGITGFLHLLSTGEFHLLPAMTQRMYSNVDSFTLLAIPFFILAGELMNASGITTKLIGFSRSLIGYVRGGIGYVNVVVALFLGAIVGSANAEAAIRGSMMVPEMEKDGYDRDFSSALTATSSIIGPIHPPSLIFIIYGVAASTSIGALFLAGIIPAFLIAVAHMVVVYFYVRKKGVALKKHPFPTFKEFWLSFYQAIPALLIPLIILGGIYSGIFTPTESGAIACFVALIVGLFVYRTLKLSHLPKILLHTGIITASITFIIATSNILGWSLAIEQLPQKIASVMLAISDSPIVILLLINVLLLIVGMFLDITAALLILVPVLLPVVTSIGVDPVHFGLIISINLALGLVTPPVGVVLFVTSNVTKVPLQRLVKACVPFFISILVTLLVVTYVPELSLFLPKMAGLIGQ